MVLVCHKHEFVFLKTRKTAGTSVEMVLEKLCLPEGSEIVNSRPASVTEYGIVGRRGHDFKPFGWRRPLRLTEWSDHHAAASVKRRIGAAVWDRYRKFTTVRNPFDRMVSYFVFQQRPDAQADFSAIRAQFRDYVQKCKWRDDRRIVHVNGRLIIDRAIRFEALAQDFRDLVTDEGLPVDPDDLPVTNSMAKSRKKHDVPDYFDDDLIEIVKKRMSWVFDHFDYPLEPQPKFSPA